ncbi:MAG: hypothetical protein IJ336_02380 [Lachnospiraceae bacterium]|nr:hypothetical protein [Lachnospiraceae bacterium]
MFCRQLYLDSHTSKDFDNLRRKFRNHNFPSGIYVIVLSKISGRVEYFDCRTFKQKYYKETANYPLIIGLAKGAESAQNIVVKIIEETYAAKQNADVKAYLKEKCGDILNDNDCKYDITVIVQEGEK